MSEFDAQKVIEMVRDLKIGMMTSVAADGRLLARPMTTQEAADNGDLLFIAERDSDQVRALQADPRVNVAYAGKGTWLSVAGHASVVEDDAKLRELWDRMTDAFTEGGPDNPNNILLKVTAETAEYWGGNDDGAGGRVGQLVRMVKAVATGERPESHNDTVDLR